MVERWAPGTLHHDDLGSGYVDQVTFVADTATLRPDQTVRSGHDQRCERQEDAMSAAANRAARPRMSATPPRSSM